MPGVLSPSGILPDFRRRSESDLAKVRTIFQSVRNGPDSPKRMKKPQKKTLKTILVCYSIPETIRSGRETDCHGIWENPAKRTHHPKEAFE